MNSKKTQSTEHAEEFSGNNVDYQRHELTNSRVSEVAKPVSVTQLTCAYNTPGSNQAPPGLVCNPSSASETSARFDFIGPSPTKSFHGYAMPLSTFQGIDQLMENNKRWARTMVQEKHDFFTKLASLQAPKILWIGCSDSRVPANQIIGLGPGEVFVHRNVANIVHHTDLNCMSVVQYAVDVLKVEHIIVCGHYGCGGVLASMTENSYGLIDHWLTTIKHVYAENRSNLEDIEDWKLRADALCELNILRSVRTLCSSTIIETAWDRGQNLDVHGWCYRLTDGIIRDLKIRVDSTDKLGKIHESFATSLE